MNRHFAFFLFFSALLWTQEKPTVRPAFDDYRVEMVYHGKPAVPQMSKDQRMFRTVIRRGADAKVEFAGHYTVPVFGCGAGCASFYIVDSISGKVYDGFAVEDFPSAWIEHQGRDYPARIQYVPSSRLLKINGCPNERDCGFYDYEMVDGKGLRIVYKHLLPKDFQP
jgi:hypothetical protein